MLKAYDTMLQSEVPADLAAQSGGFEPYRYECACCGEEVYIAAAYSTSMVPHFRHRSGNNDVECENYLGQIFNAGLFSPFECMYAGNAKVHRHKFHIFLTAAFQERFDGCQPQVKRLC